MFTAYGSNLQTLCSTGLQVCVKKYKFQWKASVCICLFSEWGRCLGQLGHLQHQPGPHPVENQGKWWPSQTRGPKPCVTVGAEAKPGPSSPACASPSAPPAWLPPVCVPWHCSQGLRPYLPSWCQCRSLLGLVYRKICLKGLHIPRNRSD